MKRALLVLCLWLSGSLTATALSLEPDRLYREVGPWSVHTARYGVGCVAILETSAADLFVYADRSGLGGFFVAVGDRAVKEFIIENQERDSFEIAFTDDRFRAEFYDYRGASGLAVADQLNAKFRTMLARSTRVVLTERGMSLLEIPLPKNGAAMLDALARCARR